MMPLLIKRLLQLYSDFVNMPFFDLNYLSILSRFKSFIYQSQLICHGFVILFPAISTYVIAFVCLHSESKLYEFVIWYESACI